MERAVFSHIKGGVGKTTLCINVAGVLQKEGKRVLVVDLDPVGGATSGLGIDKQKLEGSLAEALNGRLSAAEAVVETESGILLLPSSPQLSSIEYGGHDDF